MTPEFSQRASRLRRAQAERSLLAFLRTYLPEHIFRDHAPAHQEVDGLLMELTHRRGLKLAVAAPRGFGKSTLVTLAYVLYGICYHGERFIVVLSATASQAVQLLDGVRRELTSNAKLLTDFPELAGPSPRPWTRADIVTATHVRVLALGVGQRIRGRKHGKDRPTLIIGDDLEDAESALSLEPREQLREWFNRSILKAGSETTNVVLLGTLHHPACLLAEYVDPHAHPEWLKRIYKAITGWATRQDLWAQWAQIYNSREAWADAYGPEAARAFYAAHQAEMDAGTAVLWPSRWRYYDLLVQKEEDPHSFSSELQNEPLNPRECLFHLEEIAYWDDHDSSPEALLRALGDHAQLFGACDPSLGRDTLHGDYTAIVILAKDTRDKLLYVLVADIARYTPDQTIETILAYYQRYPFSKFVFETNQFQELLAQQFERRSRELGLYPPIERVTHTRDKILRLQGLQPWIKNGTVRFTRRHTQLLDQLRVFPKGKYDDGPDALAMAVRLAEDHYDGPFLRIIHVNPDDTDPDDIEGGNVKWQSLE